MRPRFATRTLLACDKGGLRIKSLERLVHDTCTTYGLIPFPFLLLYCGGLLRAEATKPEPVVTGTDLASWLTVG